jgi:hypothetical protein
MDYLGGPSDLMASLSAQMERERLERVEPRLPGHDYVPSPCPYCDQCKQSCALTCLVCLVGVVVIAVVAMVR